MGMKEQSHPALPHLQRVTQALHDIRQPPAHLRYSKGSRVTAVKAFEILRKQRRQRLLNYFAWRHECLTIAVKRKKERWSLQTIAVFMGKTVGRVKHQYYHGLRFMSGHYKDSLSNRPRMRP